MTENTEPTTLEEHQENVQEMTLALDGVILKYNGRVSIADKIAALEYIKAAVLQAHWHEIYTARDSEGRTV